MLASVANSYLVWAQPALKEQSNALSLMDDIQMFAQIPKTLEKLFLKKGKTLIKNPDFVFYRYHLYCVHCAFCPELTWIWDRADWWNSGWMTEGIQKVEKMYFSLNWQQLQ